MQQIKAFALDKKICHLFSFTISTLYSDFLSSSVVQQSTHYSIYLFISNISLSFYEIRFLSANQNIRHITGL